MSELAAKDYKKKAPIDTLLSPIQRFMAIQSSSGILLLFCTIVALILANTSLAPIYHAFWQTMVTLQWEDIGLQKSLMHLINDGLMTIFFFVVGLEIKREVVAGELNNLRRATLPIVAALGGMVVPALVFWSIAGQTAANSGWGIPMATDIAFVVGFLSLLGNRVPNGLKILLLTLAIADDIGAVLVIAIFYTQDISLLSLFWSAFGIFVVLIAQRLGIRRFSIYVILGAATWLALLKSGVHPTIAGVVLGLITPWRAAVEENSLIAFVKAFLERRKQKQRDSASLLELDRLSMEAVSPLEKLEHELHPWVAFFIMPMFALANAGVSIELGSLSSTITWAVALGLFIGKPLGILGFSWLAVRFGFASLPAGVNWKVMLGAGLLAGIGFTMSLFIAGLALEGGMLDAAKVGTLLGSCMSAILGLFILHKTLTRRAANSEAA